MALDSDNKDLSTRLIKTARGIPNEIDLSDTQMILKTQAKQLEAMKKLSERRPAERRTQIIEKYVPPAPAEVSLDITAMAEQLEPQFTQFTEAQEHAAQELKHLGYIGEIALRYARLQTGTLDQLNKNALEAISQRNAALSVFRESVANHEATNQLLHINGQLIFEGNQIATAGNAKLDAIGAAIFNGFSELGGEIRSLKSEVKGLNRQLIASTVAIIDQMRRFEDVFLWAHRQQNKQLQFIAHALHNPVATRSQELWNLGEKARKFGRPDHARSLYERSVQENPTFARAHYSLGQLDLDEHSAEQAKAHFAEGIRYSADEPKFQAAIYLLCAKVERMSGSLESALAFAEQSLSVDNSSYETWYELSLAHALLGNEDKAIYYLKNLLRAAENRNTIYVAKVMSTPTLFPYISKVYSLIT